MKEDLIFAHSIAIIEFCGNDELASWNIGKVKKDYISSEINYKTGERVFLTTTGEMENGFRSGIIYF